ncbi:HEAT repeat domain-containing protein [Embleya sp. NPDC001921]
MIRLVLARKVNRRKVLATAEVLEFTLVEEFPANHPQPYELVFTTPWSGVSVHYQEDTLLGVPYLTVLGAEPTKTGDLIAKFLPLDTIERLVLRAYGAVTSEEKTDVVSRIAAAGGPEPHSGAYLVFQACFADPDPWVRDAAAFATAYLGWPVFRESLERLAAQDPAPEVQESAVRALKALERHYWRE